jgi:hypothetical protein
MGDSGVRAILGTLGNAHECKIEDLALEQNEIGEEGAIALVEANLPNLVRLRLADNEDMPKDGLQEKYGKVVDFGDDDDEKVEGSDEGNEEVEKEVDDIGALLAASHL